LGHDDAKGISPFLFINHPELKLISEKLNGTGTFRVHEQ